MKPLRLSALAAALVLAACNAATPTDPAALDAAPSFDAGPGMMGSGNGVGTIGSGHESTISSDSAGGAERGGGMLGSGN